MSDSDISEGNWLVYVAGVEGSFQMKSGGLAQVAHTKTYDGGSLNPVITQGKPDFTDLTISRSFRMPRDIAIKRDLTARLATGQKVERVVTCTPLNEQMVPVGDSETIDAVLKSVSGQDANANSSNPSKLELVFTVLGIR